MKIGSLFSGIGGLDLACEEVFGGETIWQVERDPYCQKVLAARWPDAERFDDVTQVSADVLEPCDVLCGGFPCQDLSVAGKRAGLDGERSGLYSEMLRLVAELRPRFVVFENVPALMSYRIRVDGDLQELGYGSIWTACDASSVGAPHRRRRVFVLASRGGQSHETVSPAYFDSGAHWPTPCAMNPNETENLESWDARRDRLAKYTSALSEPLAIALRRYGDGVVNPEWVELLMGLGVGWTQIEQRQTDLWQNCTFKAGRIDHDGWPLGRGAAQAPHEPPRLVPRKSVHNRRARLRALGNAVVPQQAIAALRRMVAF